MNLGLSRLKQAFTERSPREQWLIALAGWFAILALGALVFLEPTAKQVSRVDSQRTQSENTTRDLAALNQLKQQKLDISPDTQQRQTLEALQQELEKLDLEVREKVSGLVSAPEMAHLMEDVLSHSGSLTLLSLQSLPAQKLTDGEHSDYYIHPVKMTLKGRYFDIVNYLSALEALPVKYYWQSVSYRVTEYPWAEVTINVYTLGKSQVFIGGVVNDDV